MAASNAVACTFPVIAEWRNGGKDGPGEIDGVLTTKTGPDSRVIMATVDPTGNFFHSCPSITVTMVPVAVSGGANNQASSDQSISVMITADNIAVYEGLTQKTPKLNALPTHVRYYVGMRAAELRNQRPLCNEDKQPVVLAISLQRNPFVLMPRHKKSLCSAKQLARVKASRSLSLSTHITLYFIPSPAILNSLNNFRNAVVNYNGPNVEHVRDSATHFSFRGLLDQFWDTYQFDGATAAQTQASANPTKRSRAALLSSPEEEEGRSSRRTKYGPVQADDVFGSAGGDFNARLLREDVGITGSDARDSASANKSFAPMNAQPQAASPFVGFGRFPSLPAYPPTLFTGRAAENAASQVATLIPHDSRHRAAFTNYTAQPPTATAPAGSSPFTTLTTSGGLFPATREDASTAFSAAGASSTPFPRDELVARWRQYHQRVLLTAQRFNLGAIQPMLSAGLVAAREGKAGRFAAEMGELFVYVDEHGGWA